MIIDAHTHTYPETIAKRAIEKLEKNSGTKAHTNGVQSGLMASMKEAGISYSASSCRYVKKTGRYD